jgi:phospholipase/carboxylesterase
MDTVEIQTGAKPDAAVIWLHGLGADGHDFEPIVPELRLPGALPLRFVFPHAPVRPVTLNQGMRMRAWYDILRLDGGAEDDAGIRASQGLVEALIAEEVKKGIEAARIVLAGFSQGGAIALHTALRHPAPLAGVLALSTYLPLNRTVKAEAGEANRKTPIFMAHGQYDDIIPLARAEQSRKILAEAGYDVQWKTYPMPHSVCAEEIADIASFLVRILGPSP